MMKQFHGWGRVCWSSLVFFVSFLVGLRSETFHVSPSGADTGTGRADAPFATLTAARDAARKAEVGPHRIVLASGDYFLSEPFELAPEDNGLTIEAAEPGNVTLYGGSLVTGWKKDGETFWYAELDGVKEGIWDFRALVVNGRMPDRARMPEEGTFQHKSRWDVRYLSNIAGGFERKGTEEELTTLLYDPKDIPETLEPRNAEVRVYHMWDESLVPVARNDLERHALIFAGKPKNPPGAFKVYKYCVFNTREGMTHPGQWYLDRAAGRLVYWPLPGEDMTTAKVVAPRLQRLVSITGTKQTFVEGITLRGLSLQAVTTPIDIQGSFAALAFDGALNVSYAKGCTLDRLEICNVGGQGVKMHHYRATFNEGSVTDCHIHDTGACGLIAGGEKTLVSRNHIHHVGRYYPSAVAMCIRGYGDNGLHVYRNEVHDGPYSGIIGGGQSCLIEENLIYRVMQEMHDGAAIYGNMKDCVLRGNVVRDVEAVGKGYGASAYYLDEGANNTVVERNVSIGVKRPTHNHIARDLTIRDNVFIYDGDMQISANRSAGIVFERNTLVASGSIRVSPPTAFSVWKDNVIMRNGVGTDGVPQPFTIDDAMPETAPPGRRTYPAQAEYIETPPVLDGEIGLEEWPDRLLRLDRSPSRWPGSGAPVFFRLAYDTENLYVAVNVPCFDTTKIGKGTELGTADGMEIAISGTLPDGAPVTYVLRGFTDGTLLGVTDAGASAESAKQLQDATRFVAKVWKQKWSNRGGWRVECAIPLKPLGLKPKSGLRVPFNLCIYRAEDTVWRCWEGTLAETWKLAEAGTLAFGSAPVLRPVFRVVEHKAPVVDGVLAKDEWPDKPLVFGPDGAVNVWAQTTGDTLYVAFRSKVDPTKPIKGDPVWDDNDAVEVALRKGSKGPIVLLRGYPKGIFVSDPESGATAPLVAAVQKAVSYSARIVSSSEWTAEWAIPLALLGLAQEGTSELQANFTLHRVANGNEWLSWRRERGSSWALDTAGGTLVFGAK